MRAATAYALVALTCVALAGAAAGDGRGTGRRHSGAGGRIRVAPGPGALVGLAGGGGADPSIRWPAPDGAEFLGSANLVLRCRVKGSGEWRVLDGRSFTSADIGRSSSGLFEGCEGGRRAPSGKCDDDGDGAVDEDPVDGVDNDDDGRIDEDFAAIGNDMRVAAAFDPGTGLSIRQQSYAWAYGHVRDFLGLTTTITNRGGRRQAIQLEDLEIGFMLDFDIGEAGDAGRGARNTHAFFTVDGARHPALTAGGGRKEWVAVLVLEAVIEGRGPVGATSVVVSSPDPRPGAEGRTIFERLDGGEIRGHHQAAADPPPQLAGNRAIFIRFDRIAGFGQGEELHIDWALVFADSEEALVRRAERAVETCRGVTGEDGRRCRWIVPARKAPHCMLEPTLVTVWVQGKRRPAAAIDLPPESRGEEVEWLSVGGERTDTYEQVEDRIIVPVDGAVDGGSVEISGQISDGTLFTAELVSEDVDTFVRLADIKPGKLPPESIQLYPNPFLTMVNIKLLVQRFEPAAGDDAEGQSSVRIYDVKGRLVRTVLESEFLPPGEYNHGWDGLDDGGKKAAPGVYYCKLQIGERSVTKRVILLR